jgi:hypothetical protein
VREKRGLSYSVFSAFQPQAQTGPFFIGLQTSRDNAEQALVVVQQTLADFIEKGPTAEELEAAKKNLAGGFALRLDTNRKLLDNLSQMAFYKLPPNYLDNWTKSIQAVTAAQVRDVLNRRLRIDRLNTVVVAGGAQSDAVQPNGVEPNGTAMEPEWGRSGSLVVSGSDLSCGCWIARVFGPHRIEFAKPSSIGSSLGLRRP